MAAKRKGPKPGTGGRPKIEINQKTFESLCGLWCSKPDIAAFLNIDEGTLDSWIKRTYGPDVTFSVIFAQKSSAGRVSLRRKQFELAMAGHPTMLIWLGKQQLEQTDKKAVELKNAEDETFTITLRDYRSKPSGT